MCKIRENRSTNSSKTFNVDQKFANIIACTKHIKYIIITSPKALKAGQNVDILFYTRSCKYITDILRK